MAAWMWVLYVGLEPFVRRRWPHTLIGWSRLLMGRGTDPLVGRDILAGASAGLLLAAVAVGAALTLNGAAGAFSLARLPLLTPLEGVRGIADFFGRCLFQAIMNALGLMFLLFLLRLALRRDWLMAAAFVVLMSVRMADADLTTAAVALAFQVAWSLIMVTVLARFGLLAFAVAWTVDRVVEMTPLTTDWWSWHAAPTVAGLIAVIALVAVATKVALAGRSLLGAESRGE
jgi:serine/threonine-protein kinase